MQTTAIADLEAIRSWFKLLWDASHEITPTDLERATVLWQRRRATRPTSRANGKPPGTSPLTFGLESTDLKDRVWLAMWKTDVSKSAKDAYRAWADSQGGHATGSAFYESWHGFPHEGEIIDLEIKGRTAIFGGIYVWALDVAFNDDHGTAGTIHICRQVPEVAGRKVSKSLVSAFEAAARKNVLGLWNHPDAGNDEDGRLLPLASLAGRLEP
jgi:hypothetical protein